MNAMTKLLALAAALACLPSAYGATCAENRDFYQSLPTVIGREDQTTPFGYVLKCDTVFVRKGVTTVVHPGTMFYFSKPTLYSVIKVEGTLIIKGAKGSYVYLSGSMDTLANGTRQPGSRQWGGIEVAEGGRLEMEYAGVVRAPTPITAFSPKVKIVNSFFKGSSGIILPDGNLMPLEITWHAVNNLDLEKNAKGPAAAGEENKGGLSKEEKAALLARKQEGFWTWKKAAGGAAALAVVAVGAVYLGSGDDEPTKPDPNPNNDLPDTRDKIFDPPKLP